MKRRRLSAVPLLTIAGSSAVLSISSCAPDFPVGNLMPPPQQVTLCVSATPNTAQVFINSDGPFAGSGCTRANENETALIEATATGYLPYEEELEVGTEDINQSITLTAKP